MQLYWAIEKICKQSFREVLMYVICQCYFNLWIKNRLCFEIQFLSLSSSSLPSRTCWWLWGWGKGGGALLCTGISWGSKGCKMWRQLQQQRGEDRNAEFSSCAAMAHPCFTSSTSAIPLISFFVTQLFVLQAGLEWSTAQFSVWH